MKQVPRLPCVASTAGPAGLLSAGDHVPWHVKQVEDLAGQFVFSCLRRPSRSMLMRGFLALPEHLE